MRGIMFEVNDRHGDSLCKIKTVLFFWASLTSRWKSLDEPFFLKGPKLAGSALKPSIEYPEKEGGFQCLPRRHCCPMTSIVAMHYSDVAYRVVFPGKKPPCQDIFIWKSLSRWKHLSMLPRLCCVRNWNGLGLECSGAARIEPSLQADQSKIGPFLSTPTGCIRGIEGSAGFKH
jgi:hypothetical protein